MFHMKQKSHVNLQQQVNLNAPPGGPQHPLAIHRAALRTRKQGFARVDQV